MEYTLFLIIRILLILLLIGVCGVISVIIYTLIEEAKLIKEKQNKVIAETNDIYNRYNDSITNFTTNTNDANNILHFCRTLIIIEVTNKLDKCKRLGNKYELINLDQDSKEIATAVFESLNEEFVKNRIEKSILTYDYLMKFIVNESIQILLDEAQKNNASSII